MYVIKEEKKVSIVKIIVITAAIAAGIAAIATAIMFWRKKKCAENQLDNEIDAAIEAAFAEEAQTAELQTADEVEA